MNWYEIEDRDGTPIWQIGSDLTTNLADRYTEESPALKKLGMTHVLSEAKDLGG